MPCRRCRHLRRPCEFSQQPAPADKRAPDFAGSVKDLMDRLRCMGFILKHHFPQLALDIESLRRTCDTLSAQNPRHDQSETTTAELLEPSGNAQPSESPGIEDENCTIDSVDDTTVRMCLSDTPPPAATLTMLFAMMQTTPGSSLTGISPCTSNAI